MQAMQLMKEGDKWELYIPSELGYGDEGTPGGGRLTGGSFRKDPFGSGGSVAGFGNKLSQGRGMLHKLDLFELQVFYHNPKP